MNNDNYSDGPSADNYGVDGPPPVLPNDQEFGRERPAYGGAPPERHRPPSYVRWIGGCSLSAWRYSCCAAAVPLCSRPSRSIAHPQPRPLTRH